ncbi:MAG: PQQ-binding-like beta-propeller repeat protein [Gemmataceae bacterium]
MTFRHLRRCICTAIVFAPFVTTAHAEDWPRFRGPRGDGTSAETSFPTRWSPKENILWKAKLPGPGSSSPIVWKDRVFVTCFTGTKGPEIVRHLFCFDRNKGDILWKKDFPAPQPENDYASYLLQHGFASSTPVTDGDKLYVYFGKDGVRCFDLDGALVWHELVGKAINGFGSGSSPVLFEDKLLVNATVELGALVALDRKSGKRLWKASTSDCWATPVVVTLPDGKREVILNAMNAVYGYDLDSGKEKWFVDTIGGHISSTPLVKDGVVYVMNSSLGGKHVLAIRPGGSEDVTKTHVIWKNTKAGASHCSPLLVDGRFVFISGQAFALDLKKGDIVKQERLDGTKNLYSSPILAGDKIILFTRDAGAYVLNAKDLSVIAHNDLGDASAINASPALSVGRIYIRSNTQLYCIGAK